MQHCVACSTALSAVFCMQRRSIFTHTNKTDSKYSFFNFRPELWNVSTHGQPYISYLLKTFSNHFLQILILCKVMQMSVEQNRAEANNSYQSPQRQQMKELMNSEFEPHPNCYSATEYRIQLKSDYTRCPKKNWELLLVIVAVTPSFLWDTLYFFEDRYHSI